MHLLWPLLLRYPQELPLLFRHTLHYFLGHAECYVDYKQSRKEMNEKDKDGWIDGWLLGWLDCWMDGWIDGWLISWTVGWMDGLLDG